MRGINGAAYSSRGRRLSSRGAAAAPRGGRGAAVAPRGGRGAAATPRGSTSSRGGRGAAIVPRGGSVGSTSTGSDSSTPQPSRDDHVDVEYHPSEEEGEEDEYPEADGSTTTQDFWLRGPANLPPQPTREEDKTVIVPVGDTQWREEAGTEKFRHPNGIIGVLIRWHFPGLVTYRGRQEPAWTWRHYKAAEDTADEGEIQFDHCLQRVEESFWWWFRWAEGQEADSRRVVRNVVKKLIPQMIYEARIQAVIYYHTKVLGREIHRAEACQTHLIVEAYMQTIPWWAQKCEDAWRQIAQKRWCNKQWLEASRAARKRILLMGGAAHRQDSSSMARYKKHLEKKKQRPVSDVEVYVEARRGDQEGILCSQRAIENLEAYTEAVKDIHGPSFDIMNSPLDATDVYKARKRKKHGRFLMGAGYISTPATLSEVRTTSSGSTDDVHPQRRLRPSIDRFSQLEAKLQEEIEARQRLEQMILALHSQLDSSTPGAPLPTLSNPGTAGSMVDSTAPDGDAGDGTHVSTPNQDHVDESIVQRPLEDNANESTHK